MPTDPSGILFELGIRDPERPDALLDGYLKHVANGGLGRYKTVIQTGVKAGEPLYVHVLNGVLTAERLRSLVGLSATEVRVLWSAYSVHDINKPEGLGGAARSFNRLAESGRVQAELEAVGVPGFFPEYRAYLADITLLVRRHSAHYAAGAELLVLDHDPYRLPRERLSDVLVPLMRALDVLDLSTTLEEITHKQAFLGQLDRITPGRHIWVRHRVSEQRGMLTNVMHNAVVEHLAMRFNLTPLAFYPQGVAYLADAATHPVSGCRERDALGLAVVEALASKSRQDFAKFIRSRPSGIVVAPECLQLGIGFTEIFEVVYNLGAVT